MNEAEDATVAQAELRALQKEIDIWKWGLVIAISGLAVIYIAWFSGYHTFPLSSDPAGWGQLGDFFGGLLNPVVAFAAFYWLTRSVALQKQELAETRKELGKAANAQDLQVEKAQVNVQIAALGQLNSIFASEIQRSEENLRSLKVENGGEFHIRRRYFEERLWEFQEFQKKVMISLTAGLRGEWNDSLHVEIPSKRFAVSVSLIKTEYLTDEFVVVLSYGNVPLWTSNEQSIFRSCINHICRTGPADMSSWEVVVDGISFGEFPVSRANSSESFQHIATCVQNKYPERNLAFLYRV